VHTFPVGYFGSAGGDAVSIQSVVSSACFDLDATQPASIGTANEWKNLVAVPADGAGQTDYDFYLGLSRSQECVSLPG